MPEGVGNEALWFLLDFNNGTGMAWWDDLFLVDMTQGDVNCDGLVNVVDALFILQHEVGLRVDSGGCPLPSPPHDLLYVAGGDVDTNGLTNVVDALFILQCEVGVSPGAEMPFCAP